MQAVILAAGKSTRTYPLTLTKPKALLKAANKTIIEHNLKQLKGIVSEAIIVVGYRKEQIQEHLGSEYEGIKITYAEQEDQNGTGGALLACKDKLKDKFIVMNGDDFFSQKDIQACIQHDFCLLVQEVESPERFGIAEVDGKKVTAFTEKPKNPTSNLANTGFYVFDTSIFEHELQKSARDEYEITDYLSYLISSGKELMCETVSDYWLPIGYPWDLLAANEHFVSRLEESEIKGEVEDGVTIRGKIIVGEGTIIKTGTYIEGNVIFGKNCKIGPNCYIRGNSTFGDNCNVLHACEVKNSIFGDGSKAPHLNCIGDSVVGDGVNLAAGTIVANLRHDKSNVKSVVKEELVDSGRRKFGTIIGDGVHLGIKTLIYPGRKIGPHTTTVPGEIITKDKVE